MSKASIKNASGRHAQVSQSLFSTGANHWKVVFPWLSIPVILLYSVDNLSPYIILHAVNKHFGVLITT